MQYYAYHLVSRHACEAAVLSATLPPFGSNVLNFFLGTVGEIARVGVVCHDDSSRLRCFKVSIEAIALCVLVSVRCEIQQVK